MYRTEVPRENYFTDKKKKLPESVFNIRYLEVWRYYHFHFEHSENSNLSQSFSYFPLSGLLRGVFLEENAAHNYASLFYEDGQLFVKSDFYKKFLYE